MAESPTEVVPEWQLRLDYEAAVQAAREALRWGHGVALYAARRGLLPYLPEGPVGDVAAWADGHRTVRRLIATLSRRIAMLEKKEA